VTVTYYFSVLTITDKILLGSHIVVPAFGNSTAARRLGFGRAKRLHDLLARGTLQRRKLMVNCDLLVYSSSRFGTHSENIYLANQAVRRRETITRNQEHDDGSDNRGMQCFFKQRIDPPTRPSNVLPLSRAVPQAARARSVNDTPKMTANGTATAAVVG